MIDADGNPEIKKEMKEMSGIGESLVLEAKRDKIIKNRKAFQYNQQLIRKEVSEMSGIGESLVLEAKHDADIASLQRFIVAGKIGSVDEAKDFYPSLEEDDIQKVFNSLHDNTSN